jgi:hypothetical protein
MLPLLLLLLLLLLLPPWIPLVISAMPMLVAGCLE